MSQRNRGLTTRGMTTALAALASALLTATWALATGCYVEQGSLCSTLHNGGGEPCPDTYEVDFQIEKLDTNPGDVPGHEGLEFKTCWVYVQSWTWNATLGECVKAGFPAALIYNYTDPYGTVCYP